MIVLHSTSLLTNVFPFGVGQQIGTAVGCVPLKSGSELRQTIIDLSLAKGVSVNEGDSKNTYLGTDFQLHSVDTCNRITVYLGHLFIHSFYVSILSTVFMCKFSLDRMI